MTPFAAPRRLCPAGSAKLPGGACSRPPALLNSAPRSSQCAQIGGGALSSLPRRHQTPARRAIRASSLLELPGASASGVF
jgi:hypothetical protein